MKITKQQLKQIIAEELDTMINATDKQNEGLDQINPENMGVLMNALKHFASQPAVLSAMAMGGVAAAVSKIKDMMDQEDAMGQDD